MSKFVVKSIRISKFYNRSFHATEISGLDEGFNIVLGENGSGKSTIGRGLSYLFNSSPNSNQKNSVDATFWCNSTLYNNIQVEDQPRIDWPQSVRPDLYRLESIDNAVKLNSADTTTILSALEGGVNFVKLLTVPNGLQNPPGVPPGQNQKKIHDLARKEALLPEQELKVEKLKTDVSDLEEVRKLNQRIEKIETRKKIENEIKSLKDEYKGIDKQSENAAAEAENKSETASNAKEDYEKAEQDLEPYGGPAKKQLNLEDQQKLDQLIQESENIENNLKLKKELLIGLKKKLVALGVDPDLKVFQIKENSLTEDEAIAQEDNDHNSFEEPTDEEIISAQDLDREIIEANRILQWREEQYKDAAEKLHDARKELDKDAAEKLHDARKELDIEENPDTNIIPAKEILNQLNEDPSIASLADDVREYNCAQTANQALHKKVEGKKNDWLNQLKNDTVVRDAERAEQTLRDWLVSQSETPAHQSAVPKWLSLALSTGLFAIGIFVVKCSVSKLIPNIWVAGAVIVLGLLALVYNLFNSRKEKPFVTSTTSPWERHQRDTPDYFKPENWTVPEVCLKLAEATKTKATANGWDAVINDTNSNAADDSQSKKQKLQNRIQTFKKETGIVEIDPYVLAALVQKLLRLHQLEDDFNQAKSNVKSAREGLQKYKDDLTTFLKNRANTGQELADLRSAWRDYREERSSYDDLIKEQNKCRTQAKELQEKYHAPEWDDPLLMLEPFREWFQLTDTLNQQETALQKSIKKLTDYLDGQGAPANEDLQSRVNELSRRHETAKAYKDLQEDLRQAKANENAVIPKKESIARQNLSFNENDDTENSTPEEITKVLEVLEPKAKEREELEKIIQGTKTLVQNAEEAEETQTYKENLERLTEKIQRFTKQHVRNKVIEVIKNAVRKEDTPAVVKSANEWLKKFTNNRYDDLTVHGDASKKLKVTDTLDGEREKSFEELNTGTKIHVALAIRLAAIETSEETSKSKTKFPLILDDLLAHSDDQNFAAISSAMKEISKDRQVIYFTKESSDVQRLSDNAKVLHLGNPRVREVPPQEQFAPENQPIGDHFPLSQNIMHWPIEYFAVVRDITGYENKTAKDFFDQESLDALDKMRKKVLEAHRTLEWTHVEEKVTPAMEKRIKEVFDQSNGNLKVFFAELNSVDQIRTNLINKIHTHLEDQGFFTPPPTMKDLVDEGKQFFEGTDAKEKASSLASLFHAYLSR
jgi:uncharacterized protein YhaN